MDPSHTGRHSVEANQNRLMENNSSNINKNENNCSKGMTKQQANKKSQHDCKHARL